MQNNQNLWDGPHKICYEGLYIKRGLYNQKTITNIHYSIIEELEKRGHSKKDENKYQLLFLSKLADTKLIILHNTYGQKDERKNKTCKPLKSKLREENNGP